MRIYIIIALWLIGTVALAQKPQPILGIAKENRSIEYYKEQSRLWQQVIKSDPKKGVAWQNYYRAERAIAQLNDLSAWNNDKSTVFNQLKPIITKCKATTGNSYDYYYLEGMNTVGDRAKQFFEKAYTIDPDRPEVHGWLFGEYVLSFNQDAASEIGPKILQNNIYSNANLMWNYNALISAEPNSIFITNADMDCLPKWTLQYGQGIRPDVLVISKWVMVGNLKYRKEILQRIGATTPEKDITDFEDAEAFVDYLTAHMIRKSKRPVYMSSGTDINFLRAYNLQDDMYVVGAALKYSTKDFDNIHVMQNNFEEKYKMEYLFLNFQSHAQDAMIKAQMNLTYLPFLFSLKEFYTNNRQTKESVYCEKLINKIAEDSGRSETVLSWFQ